LERAFKCLHFDIHYWILAYFEEALFYPDAVQTGIDISERPVLNPLQP
jgi:hypothetical protein